MSGAKARVWIVKLWWTQRAYDGWNDVPRWYTPGNEENLATFRVGRLVFAWGVEFHE